MQTVNTNEHFVELKNKLMSGPLDIVKDLCNKLKIQNVLNMSKKDQVDSIIKSVQDIIQIKYKPKTAEEFRSVAKVLLDTIIPQLTKTTQHFQPNSSQPQLTQALNSSQKMQQFTPIAPGRPQQKIQPGTQHSQQSSAQFGSSGHSHQHSNSFHTQTHSGVTNNSAKSSLIQNWSPMDQLKLINLTNCICDGKPMGSNLLINCKNLLPHPPFEIQGLVNKNIPISPYACPLLFHHGCHPYPKKDLDTFMCPRCQILTNDPLCQIIHVLQEPVLMFQKKFILNFQLTSTQYRLLNPPNNSNLQEYIVEVRCLKLDGQHFFEQTWPDKMVLNVNGKLAKEVKPMHTNSSLKKRKDEKYQAKYGWKIGNNKVELIWENLYDGKNSYKESESWWNGKGVPYVVTVVLSKQVGISGIIQRVAFGGSQETHLQNAIAIEQNKKLPTSQMKKLTYFKPPEELSFIESYEEKWKNILCLSTGGIYGVGRRLTIDESKIFIMNRFKEGTEEGELGISEIKVDLLCKITFTMIQNPARGVNCTHLDCFNLKFFVQSMEHNSVRKWTCPICKKKCTQFVIDTYLEYILNELEINGESKEKVFFNSNAEYTFQGVNFEEEEASSQEDSEAEMKQDASNGQSLQASAIKTQLDSGQMIPERTDEPSFQERTTEKKLSRKKNQISKDEIDIMSIISSEDEDKSKNWAVVQSELIQSPGEMQQEETPIQENMAALVEPLSQENKLSSEIQNQVVSRNSKEAEILKSPSSWSLGKQQPKKIPVATFNRPSPSINQNLSNFGSQQQTAKQSSAKLNVEGTIQESKVNLKNLGEQSENKLERTNAEKNGKNKIKNRIERQGQEDDDSDSRSESQKSIKQLLNNIQPLQMPEQPSRASTVNSKRKIQSISQLKQKLVSKNPKIDLSGSTSNLTSLSRSETTQNKPPTQTGENGSANLTNFVPQSELSQSNIMMELPLASNRTDENATLGEQQVETLETRTGNDAQQRRENLDERLLEVLPLMNESFGTVEENVENGVTLGVNFSSNKKSSKVKSKHSSLQKITQEENQDLQMSIQSKSKRAFKTSNLTPQKSTSSIQQEFNELTPTKHSNRKLQETQIYNCVGNATSLIQENGEAENLGGQELLDNQNKIDTPKKLNENIQSSQRAPENLNSPERSKNLVNLSLDKSQNLEINLDEYSPITVGYSSKIQHHVWDNHGSEFPASNILTNFNSGVKNATPIADNITPILNKEKEQSAILSFDEQAQRSPRKMAQQSEAGKIRQSQIIQEEGQNLLEKRPRSFVPILVLNQPRQESKKNNFYFKSDETKDKTRNELDSLDTLLNTSMQMDLEYKADMKYLSELYKYSEHRISLSNKITSHLGSFRSLQKTESENFALEKGGSISNSDQETIDNSNADENRGWFKWQEEIKELKLQEEALQRHMNLLIEYIQSRQKKLSNHSRSRQDSITEFERLHQVKEAKEICKTLYKMQKSTSEQNLAFGEDQSQDEVVKKIKRSDRNDADLYKGMITQYGFDDARDNTIINLKENQSLGEALKGKSADCAIEILQLTQTLKTVYTY